MSLPKSNVVQVAAQRSEARQIIGPRAQFSNLDGRLPIWIAHRYSHDQSTIRVVGTVNGNRLPHSLLVLPSYTLAHRNGKSRKAASCPVRRQSLPRNRAIRTAHLRRSERLLAGGRLLFLPRRGRGVGAGNRTALAHLTPPYIKCRPYIRSIQYTHN